MTTFALQSSMECTPAQYAVAAAFLSALAAALSAITAVRNFKLARSIQEDAKSDERIVVGKISHPSLSTQAHADAVLQIPVFNKSKRKATITDLTVYDRRNQPIPIDWSSEMSDLGMPLNPANLAGLTDAGTLFVRRRDGKSFDFGRIMFADSFSSTKNMVVFDPAAEFATGQA